MTSANLVEHRIVNAWDIPDIDDHRGVHIRGYFKANKSGAFNFWASADDTLAVYLNQTPNT